jgi:CRISPR-associated protein Csm1
MQEVSRIPRGDGAASTLLALLRKYTWAIPSDTRRDVLPDISLYHHLKTTAAIAACLVREELTEDEVQTLHMALTRLFLKAPLTPAEQNLVYRRQLCTLVKGDISGTQDFLYLLTSSGAARGLRGRSFYLQLLTEVIAAWILRQFDLPMTNLIFAGGGHFYLLLPYHETLQKLDHVRQQIATKLWGVHHGDLSLTVGFVPVAAGDFLAQEAGGNGFAAKWDEVSRVVNERKQRKWHDLGGDAMLGELFTAQQYGTTAEEMCQVCHGVWQQGIDSMDDGVRKCHRCFEFEDLGRRLRDPTHLILFTVPATDPSDNPDWRMALQAFGVVPWVIHAGEGVPKLPHGATTAVVYALDCTDCLRDDVKSRFCWGDLPVSYDFRWLADATPVKGYDIDGPPIIAEFSDLARASDGVEWLGVLRMDVDNLGNVFKHGFKHDLSDDATISRMSTLSESLRLFFEAWVPRVCREYNDQVGQHRLYLLYAGGDDLFVVGAWSALPELARKIRADFNEFVGGHHVTLSGGIAIEHQKFPLYQLAESARYALDEQAKAFTRPLGGHLKDALCFLQTSMGWEHFDEVAAWKEQLLSMLKPDGAIPALPRGFLSRLTEIHALYAENSARKNTLHQRGAITLNQMQEMIQYDRWRWRLVYQLGRFGERYREHQDTINRLGQEIMREGGLIADLRVLVRWTALLTREE